MGRQQQFVTSVAATFVKQVLKDLRLPPASKTAKMLVSPPKKISADSP
jgi:hypothetical protein